MKKGTSTSSRWLAMLLVSSLLAVCFLPVAAAANSTKSADSQAIDAHLTMLELAELRGNHDEYVASLAQLELQMTAGDNAAWHRFERLSCWYQPQATRAEFEQAIKKATALLQAAQQRRDKVAQADLTLCRGWYHELLTDFSTAKQDYSDALLLSGAIEHARLTADALSLRAELLSHEGELAQALEDFQAAQALYETTGSTFWAANNLSDIANTYRRMGDYQRSLELLMEVEGFHKQRGDREGVLSTRHLRALTLDDLGEHETAQMLYAELLADAQHTQSTKLEFVYYLGLADSQLRDGNVDAAARNLNLAKPLLNLRDDPNNWALWQLFKGHEELAQQKFEAALMRAGLAKPVVSEQNSNRYLAWVLKLEVDALAGLKRWQDAYLAQKVYEQNQLQLAQRLREQNTTRLRVEFDSARKESENTQLKADHQLQDARLQAIEERKKWQLLVTALSAVLVGLLMFWALRQMKKSKLHLVLALTDELTKLPNRRSIQTCAEKEIALAKNNDSPLSIVVFDVDYFKRINDTWGHLVGDRILEVVARAAQDSVRSIDKVGRTGGDEFVVILPSADLDRAVEVAQRLCNGIADTDLREIADNLEVSVSAGVAQLTDADTNLSLLMQRADNALYRAKDAGRNRVAVEI